MIIGSVFELILGNTFPSVVFGSYGAFWLSFGATLVPFYDAAGAYAEGDQLKGFAAPAFNNSYAFFLLFLGFMSFLFMIAGTRTNVVLLAIFFTLVFVFTTLAAAFWNLGKGNTAQAVRLQTAGGAFAFVTSMLGWYIFFAQLLASVDFPIEIPLGDLSGMIKGASERAKARKERNAV